MSTDTITLTPSQAKAFQAMMSGYNLFLTGHAGTGKSFLMKHVISELQEQGKHVVVAAPTGIAAINVGGTTLHRLFMLKPDVYTDKKPRVPAVLKETDVLFIDEISMCRIDLFDYIGRVLQATHRHIQVIVVGDFCQLPPVMPNKADRSSQFTEKEILDTHFGFDVGGGYAFLSPQWTRLNFKTVVLQEVVRQDDPEFIRALDYARLGDRSSLVYFQRFSSPYEIPDGVYIAGRNKEVDQRNSDKLEEIDHPSFFYNAECDGEVTNEDKRVAPELLELKVGARVMMICNDDMGEYVNGSLGHVTKLDNGHVFVQIDDGNECEIHKNTWEIVRYELEQRPDSRENKFKRKVVGRYRQYPIRLAWAVTIHKSQGQTFKKANLNPNCWDSGQLYVALSRVTTITGLHISGALHDRYLKLDPAIYYFYAYVEQNEPDDAGIARDMVYTQPSAKKSTDRTNGNGSTRAKTTIAHPDQMSIF